LWIAGQEKIWIFRGERMKIKGFLVIFLLVVIVVFFLYVIKQGDKSRLENQVDAFAEVKDKTTRTNMGSLEKAIDLFIAQQGKVPEDLKEIQTFSRSIYVDTDSWGNKIKYERISDSSYRLVSAGKDKTFHTEDDIVIEN
jgi:hypothetical protein